MFLFTYKSTRVVIFIAMILGFTQVLAMDDERPLTFDEVILMVEKDLPAMISNDNTELVSKMLRARLGSPISKRINIAGSLKSIFGRRRPVLDPNCLRTFTPSGDPAPDECTASSGSPAGQGAYTEFRWSKNLQFGNVKFLRRDADGTVDPGKLPPIKMSDEQAHKVAVDFLSKTMGISPDEIPVAPENARNPFPVRTLAIGEMGPKGEKNIVPIAKVVDINRGLLVGLKDVAGRDIPYLPAPGRAKVVVTDSRILQANVQGWVELELSPKVDPKNAKTREELVKEIAESIMRKEPTNISKISLIPAFNSMKFVGTASTVVPVGLLLPAIQMVVSVVPRDLQEAEQNLVGPNSAGYSEWFSLIDLLEENETDDDE